MDYQGKEREDLKPFFQSIEKEIDDMQGLITRGYKSLPHAEFILLKITEPDKAKKFLLQLTEQYVTSANKTDKTKPNRFNTLHAVQMAFTKHGLKKLELAPSVLARFSREFLEGMSYSYKDPERDNATITERSTILGDVGPNNPDNWNWGNKKSPVDCIILCYAKTKSILDNLVENIFTDKQSGIEQLMILPTHPFDSKESVREHFGFKDGIAQPVICGFEKSRHYIGHENLLKPGEFVLGHLNEYNSYSPSPYIEPGQEKPGINFDPLPGHSTIMDLGKNGTYLVFRQIEQHVHNFYHFCLNHSREAGNSPEEKAIKLASKMMGRWPEGESLTVAPEAPGPAKGDLNNFLYAKNDEHGTGCPLGAHVRRTNPRDHLHAGRNAELSLEMSKKHRILRRGRIYGDPLSEEFTAAKILEKSKSDAFKNRWEYFEGTKMKAGKGIHFMCLVSDIARQYEFVQNVWANSISFADLGNESDPIIYPRRANEKNSGDEFTTPQEVLRNRYKDIPDFTTVIGGAYFFMPGIKALKFILT